MQLLTEEEMQQLMTEVLQAPRFEQLLTLSPIKSEKSGLRKYDVSSSYLPKDAV